jgi:hypothetical protein
MRSGTRSSDIRRSWGAVPLLSVLVVLLAALGILAGSAGASASPGASADATTCPSTYSPSTTVPCTTSTTTVTYHLTLTISYTPGSTDGVVNWQACGYPASAVGTRVTLELNGKVLSSSGLVLAGGCTTDPHFPVCLYPGTYTAGGLDQGFPTPMATLSVATSGGCTAATGSGVGGSGSGSGVGTGAQTTASSSSNQSGVLAFTGTDILRDTIVALLIIGAGLFLTRLTRRRSVSR